jgi:hypothetical protein
MQPCGVLECGSGARWHAGPWSMCDAPCGGGHVTRDVWCETANGSRVDDALCTLPKLDNVTVCNVAPCSSYLWQVREVLRTILLC